MGLIGGWTLSSKDACDSQGPHRLSRVQMILEIFRWSTTKTRFQFSTFKALEACSECSSG